MKNIFFIFFLGSLPLLGQEAVANDQVKRVRGSVGVGIVPVNIDGTNLLFFAPGGRIGAFSLFVGVDPNTGIGDEKNTSFFVSARYALARIPLSKKMRVNLSPSFFYLGDGENRYTSARMNAFLSYQIGKLTIGGNANVGVSDGRLPSGSFTGLSFQTGGALEYRISDAFSVGADYLISLPDLTWGYSFFTTYNF